MSLNHRIYLASATTNFGNWLTFISVALLVQEKFGSSATALLFAFQAAPAIFLTRSVSKRLNPDSKRRNFLLLQLGLAINVAILGFFQSRWNIYCYAMISSLLASVASALYMALLGDWLEDKERPQVIRRVSAIAASALALAPAIGGALVTQIGYSSLFFIDSFTFIAVIGLLYPLPSSRKMKENLKTGAAQEEVGPKISAIPNLSRTVIHYRLFLVAGALLNALEFALFSKLHLTKTDSGVALTAWGVGNLVAFVTPKIPKSWTLLLSFFYLVAIAVSFFPFNFSIFLWAFCAAAFFYCMVSSALRENMFAALSPTEGAGKIDFWSRQIQATALINLILSCLAAGILKYSNLDAGAGILISILLLLCLCIYQERIGWNLIGAKTNVE